MESTRVGEGVTRAKRGDFVARWAGYDRPPEPFSTEKRLNPHNIDKKVARLRKSYYHPDRMFLLSHIKLPSALYLRNPEDTALGRSIVGTSVELMYEIGFEAFTFKKLAAEMKSTEASVYRYFSNKHQLLQYLIAWYWMWVLDLLKRRTLNVSDSTKCLRAAISVLVDSGKRDDTIPHIDESKLQKVVVIEGPKAGRSEARAKASENPSFDCYRLVCDELSTHIKSYKPRYKSPRTLATTLVFTAHQLQQLARLKNNPLDIRIDDRDEKELSQYLETILFSVLG